MNSNQVGYAFVNFISTSSLLEFIRTRVGLKWNMFSSEKVLQVKVIVYECYPADAIHVERSATLRFSRSLQIRAILTLTVANNRGKAALISKFRSVSHCDNLTGLKLHEEFGCYGSRAAVEAADLLVSTPTYTSSVVDSINSSSGTKLGMPVGSFLAFKNAADCLSLRSPSLP